MSQPVPDEIGECVKLLLNKKLEELTPAERERIEAVKPQILERLQKLTEIFETMPLT